MSNHQSVRAADDGAPPAPLLRPSRRGVIGAFVAGLAAGPLLLQSALPARAQDTFDIMRRRYAGYLIGVDVDPTVPVVARAVARLNDRMAAYAAMNKSEGRTALWDELPLTTRDHVGNSYVKLRALSIAWATPGTDLYGDEEIGGELVAAMRFLYENGYNPSLDLRGNWWYPEIGNPQRILTACTMLYDVMPEADREDYMATIAHYSPDPNRYIIYPDISAGSGRVNKSSIHVLRGILSKDGDVIAEGRDALSDVEGDGERSIFGFVTSGDGFYSDGSFIQHKVLPYTGAYGNTALKGTAELLALLSETEWEVTDPQRDVILDAPGRTFAPVIWNGMMMDIVRGRTVARQSRRQQHDAFTTVDTLTQLALTIGEPRASHYLAMAKGWIERCPYDYYETASVPTLTRALAVLDATVDIRPEPIEHRKFAAFERSVHRGEGWAFTVATTSSRIGRYEWGNRENNLGWYQGDGMTYLYLDTDMTQFGDEFWPTVDNYRMPGTTVSLAERESGERDGTQIPRGTQAWAGGAALEDVGVIGMDHLNHDASVAARKSWFCLPGGVVALGAAITGTGPDEVITVVENRNLRQAQSVELMVDGAPLQLSLGQTVTLAPTSVDLPGLCGYGFAPSSEVQLALTERTGSWRDINNGSEAGTADPITRTFLTIVQPHGVAPTGVDYAYTVRPGTGRPVRYKLLANEEDVQAIEVVLGRRRLIMANFFDAATTSSITADGPCSVIVSTTPGKDSQIVVAEPSRSEGTVVVSLPRTRATTVVEADDEISVTSWRRLTLSVDTSGIKGEDRAITLR